MKITKEDDGVYLHLTENTFMRFSSDWTQMFGKYNWYSISLINFSLDLDKWTGGFEVWFSLLGFHTFFRWNYDPSKLEEMLEEED